ncbi:MAG: GtrA family protein [Syntrophobacter sp.]
MRPHSLSRSTILGQMVFFAAMGSAGTFLHYSILIGLVQLLKIAPTLASTVGFIFGALTNYLLNYRYTFRSRKSHSLTIGKFYAVALSGMLLNALLLGIFVDILSLHYIPAQVLTTFLIFLWTFSGNRWWTFSGDNSAKP